MEWNSLLPPICTAVGGVIAKSLYDKWSGRTREIPLIEVYAADFSSLGNLAKPFSGDEVNLVRSSDGEKLRNVKFHRFILYNSSGLHLHNAIVEFTFTADDVQATTLRPKHSQIIEQPRVAVAGPQQILRWNIPEFPPKDSVEFCFRLINASGDYYPVIQSNQNVKIRKNTMRDIESRDRTAFVAFAIICGVALALGGFTLGQLHSDKEMYQSLVKAVDRYNRERNFEVNPIVPAKPPERLLHSLPAGRDSTRKQ
jgi:hypothetical protein